MKTPTPVEIEASAKLNTGLKNVKNSPPHKGTHSGKYVSTIGK
jgi:hypothetical protein